MIILNIKQGDITKENVDAIVNAANSRMLGGGGVDGAIHRAAGHGLVNECMKIPVLENKNTEYEIRCPVGEAKITGAYDLPAKYVIHTVGPKGSVNEKNEQYVDDERRQKLYNCWYNSLVLADEYFLKSIAFPSIATGGYLFPIKEAVPIAIAAIKNFERDRFNTSIEEITIVTFSEEDFIEYTSYVNGLSDLRNTKSKTPLPCVEIKKNEIKPYRIESYIHSDSFAENKAGALVKVEADTDFAIKKDSFKDFCYKLAKVACGCRSTDVEILLKIADLDVDLQNLKSELKENINIVDIYVM